jgi:hypothetical protein
MPGATMTERRLTTTPLAFLGAGTLIGSLFAPWYSLQFPAGLIDGITNQLAPQMGAFGGFLRQSAQLLNSAGPLNLTAFDVFKQLDVALVALGVAAMLLTLMAYTGRAAYVGQMIALAGAVAAGLIAYRIIQPPGPGVLTAHLLHVRWGAYVGLAGALLTVIGGRLISREEHRPVILPKTPASWTPAGAPTLADALPPSRATPPSWW